MKVQIFVYKLRQLSQKQQTLIVENQNDWSLLLPTSAVCTCMCVTRTVFALFFNKGCFLKTSLSLFFNLLVVKKASTQVSASFCQLNIFSASS